MDPADRFHQHLGRFGGKCEPESHFATSLLDQFRVVIDLTRKRLPKLPPIYLGVFNDRDSLNAIAFEEEGQAYIGFSYALLEDYRGFLQDYLDNEDLMREIGVVEDALLAAGFDKIVEEFWKTREREPDEDEDQTPPELLDFARADLARAVATRTLLFVLFHELGHLVNGHTALKRGNLDVGMIVEASPGSIERQALEMDADCWAVTQSLAYLNQYHQMASAGTMGPIDNLIGSDPVRALFLWFLSVNVFFRIRTQPGPMFETILERSHPPPSMRRIYIAAALDGWLQKCLDEGIKEPARTTSQIWLAAAKLKFGAWTLLIERADAAAREDSTFDAQALEAAASEEGQVHMERIHQAYADVHERLQPFARATPAPPQKPPSNLK